MERHTLEPEAQRLPVDAGQHERVDEWLACERGG